MNSIEFKVKSFVLLVYNAWTRFRNFVDKKLQNIHVEIQNAKNLAYAEKFLKEFHANRGRWVVTDPSKPPVWESEPFVVNDPTRPETWQRKLPPNPNCRHIKGGGTRTVVRDYNLAHHRFADGTEKIWCLSNCGFAARPGDANWKQAVEWMEQSSNKMSASERLIPGVSRDHWEPRMTING